MYVILMTCILFSYYTLKCLIFRTTDTVAMYVKWVDCMVAANKINKKQVGKGKI